MSAAPVVVVGAGPAGLAAALELRRRGVADVLVLEREAAPGGIPRHAQHQGFGLRDLRRPLSGPRYARRYAELVAAAGAELRTETMVTGWSPGGPLELTGPRGREQLEPAAVVLATGCRERPRSARLVPGSRPEGVMTTGTLQQLVYLKGLTPGARAVVVGAEHVSFSALLTLAHGGARTVGMVTELPRHQSLALFRAGTALRFRTPLWTRTVRQRDPRTSASGGGGAHRSGQRCRTPRRVRHRRLHRRLDPRPRARRDGWARDGHGHPWPGRGRGAANVEARRLRRRQPAARGRDGGCGCAQRPSRGRSGRRVPGRRWPLAGRSRADQVRATAAVDRSECGGARCGNAAAGALRAPFGRASRSARAWRLRRPAARCGLAAFGASCQAALPPCRTHGLRRSIRPADR